MGKKRHSRRSKKNRRPSVEPVDLKAKKKSSKFKKAPKPLRTRKFRIILALGVLVVTACVLAFLKIISLQAPENNPILRGEDLNVLLITLDTTRADRLGCYGYARAKTPNLDFLAENGVRFSHAYCPVPLTLPSHCSIMTGTYPFYHHVHNNGTYSLSPVQVTLAETLRAKNLKTAAFVASFSVDSRFGLDQGFDHYDDNFAEGSPFKALNSERKAEEVYGKFSEWLDGLSSEQFFAWVHFFDPHLPYDAPEPFKNEFADHPYDGEIAYMDSYVGAVLKKLREKNILGKTLIIIAGDHGEGLGEKVEIGHGVFLYDGTVKVPLIFYAENHLPAGQIIDSHVRLIDIMPTVLDLLNLKESLPCQGISLVPYMEKKERDDLDAYIETYYPRENFGWSELTGLISGDWKYIQAPKRELYNLKSDPAEVTNMIRSDAKTASKMAQKLKALVQNSASPPEEGKRNMSQEDMERLRSLGYVGYSDEKATGPLEDPKDKLDELRMIQMAKNYELIGDLKAASALYEEMLSERPNSSSSYVNLALIHARMNEFDQTIRILKQGIAKIPNSLILLARLGHTYFVTGRLNEALSIMKKVLSINPRYFDALTACAVILDGLGKKEESRVYYEKALAVEPENKFLRIGYAYNLATGGHIPEAIERYSRLVKDYPKEYALFQYLGIALGVAGNYPEAIENLKKAIELHPTATAYFNLAVAYKETGDTKGAIRSFELYLENPEGDDPEKIQSVRVELNNLRAALKK